MSEYVTPTLVIYWGIATFALALGIVLARFTFPVDVRLRVLSVLHFSAGRSHHKPGTKAKAT